VSFVFFHSSNLSAAAFSAGISDLTSGAFASSFGAGVTSGFFVNQPSFVRYAFATSILNMPSAFLLPNCSSCIVFTSFCSFSL
jgi:hypothetical protein